MKLFILKLLSLIVFVVGVVSLLVALGLPEVKGYLDQAPAFIADLQSKLPEELSFLREVLTVQGLWFTGSIVAIVFGIYGFAPRSTKWRKPKKISYTGPHGEVQIQLDTVEHSLNQVLARMPEVKRINVKVEPHDGGRRALIRAEVVLLQRPGQNARALASLVTDYIAETASKLLGLEDLATIELKVIGIVVNSKKSSKAIRKESLSHTSPVELLEASPTPLTLSGPREPMGGSQLEEEFEDGNGDALEADAVDTRHEVSNQAAARSELLEPLSVGKPVSNDVGAFHKDGGQDRLGESVPTAEHVSEIETLDEPATHDSDAHYAELAQEEEASPYRTAPSAHGDGEDGGEDALDDDPAYGGTLATSEVAREVEAGETPFADVHVDSTEDDSGFHAGEVVEETRDLAHDEGDEQPGEVTIPEGEDDVHAPGQEKKRWGWFN